MATEPTTQDVIPTRTAQDEQKAPQTFTQDEVNRIVANRVAKYHDYEELKEKAAKFDAAEEASKTELQKAQEKAAALQTEVEAMKKAKELREMRDEVSKETGVPAELLTAETREDCEAQAERINAYAKPSGYPSVKDAGDPIITRKGSPKESFEAWANLALG